jgi:uncharacterized repeat protein (TIGR01451 family)
VFQLTDSVRLSSALDEFVSVSAVLTYAGLECDDLKNSYSMTDIIVGSVDPNDKMVLVKNKGLQSNAVRTDTLVYKIRFQNVGTYAARRVLLVDSLSEYLD